MVGQGSAFIIFFPSEDESHSELGVILGDVGEYQMRF